MIKAVVFDMFETLVSLYNCENYTGRKIMADTGLTYEQFYGIWQGTEDDRSIGKLTFDEVIERILRENDIYSDKLYRRILHKRRAALLNTFSKYDPRIVPMLKTLRERGLRVGLITNCFFEEREAIIASDLYTLFDVTCLSCELGMKKPDRRIFEYCIEKLGVDPSECLYVGDGGSNELEAARDVGMHPVQALWYSQEGAAHPIGRLPEFEGATGPETIVKYVV